MNLTTGVIFDNLHSYHDLGMILSSAEIEAAKPKTAKLDVMGRSGSIDLTEALGSIAYSDRAIELSFTADPREGAEERAWSAAARLTGKQWRIRLEREKGRYYVGRVTDVSVKTKRGVTKLGVSITAEPYKYETRETTAVITLADNEIKRILWCDGESVTARVKMSGKGSVSLGSVSVELENEEHLLCEAPLKHGKNELIVQGSGAVTVTYRNRYL